LAKSNKEALERLQVARAAEDARLAAMWKESAEPKKKTEEPKQRYIMKGD
jgi:hypothetical protein